MSHALCTVRQNRLTMPTANNIFHILPEFFRIPIKQKQPQTTVKTVPSAMT